MSGVMQTVVVDSHLSPFNLVPSSWPVATQEVFLRDWCSVHPLAQYASGVLALMDRLQGASATHIPTPPSPP